MTGTPSKWWTVGLVLATAAAVVVWLLLGGDPQQLLEYVSSVFDELWHGVTWMFR
ncbi:hypothetical protein M8C13_04615 [Crossiella sp. SN42]|uniref:hypothetical protein n=1 Tax=Crossiella sp. SN42 TaxID=2944808 RepID=UPI00207C8C3B|nr:hypothetical protein [Crossiella sp. SN42]MCO1575042.1 hypothetical protein [Crossiella sp. SN42]